MSYLELLKLAAPEAIVVLAALAVLTIGLTTTRALVLGPIVAVRGRSGVWNRDAARLAQLLV